MWKYNDTYLYHYGVKGMKWGVRRNRDELKYDKGSIESVLKKNALKNTTSNGILITGISRHALARAEGKGRAVAAKDILDALNNPLKIGKVKSREKDGLRSQEFIGRNATTCINPDNGNIITVHRTHTNCSNTLLKKGL